VPAARTPKGDSNEKKPPRQKANASPFLPSKILLLFPVLGLSAAMVLITLLLIIIFGSQVSEFSQQQQLARLDVPESIPSKSDPPSMAEQKLSPPNLEVRDTASNERNRESLPDQKEAQPTPTEGTTAEPARLFTPDQIRQRLLRSVVWIVGENGVMVWEGSGAVIHVGKRLLLTNEHVVNNEKYLKILFPVRDPSGEVQSRKEDYKLMLKKGQYRRAKVLCKDTNRDLALLEVVEPLPADTLGLKIAPRPARPGQKLMSVGNPAASQALWAFSSGDLRSRVSQFQCHRLEQDDRIITKVMPLVMETTVPINSGDSGSPLVNEQCRIVGVNFGAKIIGNLMMYATDRDEVVNFLRNAKENVEEFIEAETLSSARTNVLALKARLQSTTIDTCRQAVVEISKLDPDDGRYLVPQLIQILHRFEDEDLHRQVTIELNRIGPPVKDDLGCFAGFMRIAYLPARRYVLTSLAQLGKDARESRDLVLEGLDDKVSEIRVKSLQVLRDLGLVTEQTIQKRLLTLLSDTDELVAQTAFALLKGTDKLHEKSVSDLLSLVRDATTNSRVLRYAVELLSRQGAIALPAVASLVQQTMEGKLGAEDQAVVTKAILEISKTQPSSVSNEMLTLTRHASREIAELGLTLLEKADLTPEQLVALSPVLRSTKPELIIRCLALLAKNKLPDSVVKETILLIRHPSREVASKAIDMLTELHVVNKESVMLLIPLLKELKDKHRLALALNIVRLDNKSKQSVEAVLPVLIRGLCPNPAVSLDQSMLEKIYAALRQIGEPAIEAIFQRFDKEPYPYKGSISTETRKRLFEALTELGKEHRSQEHWDRLKNLRAREIVTGIPSLIDAAYKACEAMRPVE